jgi:hypothetical protein
VIGVSRSGYAEYTERRYAPTNWKATIDAKATVPEKPFSGAVHEYRKAYWLTVSPQDLVYPLRIQVLEDQEQTEKSNRCNDWKHEAVCQAYPLLGLVLIFIVRLVRVENHFLAGFLLSIPCRSRRLKMYRTGDYELASSEALFYIMNSPGHWQMTPSRWARQPERRELHTRSRPTSHPQLDRKA